MTLIEKESGKSFVSVDETGKHHDYASKGVGNAALTLGIVNGALWLLNGGFGGCGNGLFGFGNSGCGCPNPSGVVANNDIQYLERKECDDYVALVNGLWEKSYAQQRDRFDDRQNLNQELFGIYSSTRNGFDVINAKHNADLFSLYKSTRDDKDAILAEVSALRSEVAVMKAVRPYQDKLIQCEIDNVAQNADFNLYRRTCRMISGEVVLPNTPVVTGFGSYNRCGCVSTTPTTSAE